MVQNSISYKKLNEFHILFFATRQRCFAIQAYSQTFQSVIFWQPLYMILLKLLLHFKLGVCPWLCKIISSLILTLDYTDPWNLTWTVFCYKLILYPNVQYIVYIYFFWVNFIFALSELISIHLCFKHFTLELKITSRPQNGANKSSIYIYKIAFFFLFFIRPSKQKNLIFFSSDTFFLHVGCRCIFCSKRKKLHAWRRKKLQIDHFFLFKTIFWSILQGFSYRIFCRMLFFNRIRDAIIYIFIQFFFLLVWRQKNWRIFMPKILDANRIWQSNF